ncbi:ribbon-helix-helix domain-containing protein [Rhodoferax sp.]|uniref:ribbon-helix-helix domain-containing protein n=1 Tax=Rhodoferax sp. TaxID=50421 RepID=UPI0025F2E091|nr:ribbon-helix-helix domain-containing protein [Rhodoferax sp.]
MCSVYVSADPIQYEARTRSLRIHNVLTTIRLENLFWDVLAEIAGREGKTTNQMITTLHDELTALREENGNFTSFLRVCCLRYLSQPGREFAVSEHPALMPTVLPAAPSLLRH